jgi:hypothetical protein
MPPVILHSNLPGSLSVFGRKFDTYPFCGGMKFDLHPLAQHIMDVKDLVMSGNWLQATGYRWLC